MRTLAIVLSAGVVAALVVFAVLDWQGWIGLSVGDLMTMRIRTFVGTLAAMGFGAPALALAFRAAFARGDRQELRELEQRVARIEAVAQHGAAAAPAAPPAGPSE